MSASVNKTALSIGIVIILALVLALCALGLAPWYMETDYRCIQCRASASQIKVLLIPMRMHVTEGDLSRYWHRNVDTNHRHEWVSIASGYRMVLQRGSVVSDHSSGSNARWRLDDRCAIPILESLPSPAARKAFIAYLWENGKGPNRDMTKNTIWALKMSFDEDPSRTDWPELLKNLGVYPEGYQ